MTLTILIASVASSIDVHPFALVLFLSPVVVSPLVSWACCRRGARR